MRVSVYLAGQPVLRQSRVDIAFNEGLRVTKCRSRWHFLW
jgi:hypothetical protein